MGIVGLTTFIRNRSHLYLEKYELHDTSLVLDGNSIACQLYTLLSSSNDCFGGDYDKFGKKVHEFFDLLEHCNIKAYVIFDGGYEPRKVNTVISRMKNKIKALNKIDCTTISVFPLMTKKVFEDIVKCRGIKHVRCDFEGDTETANIAKALNCPVLSFDSDYFIFDIMYIPFTSLEMSVKRKKFNTNIYYKYIPCSIYRVENFLRSFEGLQKSSLPILAVLLGNDYVKRRVFSMFYQNLKLQKCHGNQSDQQKRIKSLLIWLQNETPESALKSVLIRYKKTKRKIIMYKIQQAIRGYNCFDSKYLIYLGINVQVNSKEQITIDLKKVEIENEEEPETDSEEEKIDEDCVLREEEILFSEDAQEMGNSKFLKKFRQCLYPPSFMNILNESKYYCVPQIENNKLEHSHKICYDILSAMHKILTNSEEHLLCVGRKGVTCVSKVKIPICSVVVPKYEDIETLNENDKKNYILNILNVDTSFYKCLNLFPKDWHVFLLTINYYLNKSSVGWPLIYSLIMSKMILGYVDKKIGSFYRSSKVFLKKFGLFQPNKTENSYSAANVQCALEYISKNDSILCLKTLISYFEMDYKLSTNYKLFDRDLVHCIAEFQSCLMHVDHLNTLFDCPFSSVCITESLNCIFVYNMSKNLGKRVILDEYIKILFKDAPSVLYSFNFITEKLKDFLNIKADQKVISKKRKKRKMVKEIFEEINGNDEIDLEDDNHFDPNNIFSLLKVC